MLRVLFVFISIFSIALAFQNCSNSFDSVKGNKKSTLPLPDVDPPPEDTEDADDSPEAPAPEPPPVTTPPPPPPAAETQTYSYQESTVSFPNPERGWYSYAPLLGNDSYQDVANRGNRLVYAAITLRNFLNSDIDSATLNKITSRFAELRAAGVKAVLRVNYNEEDGGQNPGFAQIERHMSQLDPIIESNKDVVAYIEAGYMGPWGEWHLFEVNNPPFPDNANTWKTLIDLLLKYKPQDRFIMIRYPGKKEQVFQGQTIAANQAFGTSDIARIGHHNDCFVSSNDDVGTYQPGQSNFSSSIADLKEYLKKDTQFSPMGGETCAVNTRGACSTTLKEMADFNWTYINQDYHPSVISNWKSEGCYNEIDRRLGYRLSLETATLPKTLKAGQAHMLKLQIKNTGFGRVWNKRTAYIRVIQNGQVLANLPASQLDLRQVAPGQSMSSDIVFTMPNGITGNVDLALWLPDADSRNHSNVRMSIQLANQNTWNSAGGHNILATGVSTN